MGTVGTKTLCAFPYTTPDLSAPTAASQCTATYAQALSPGYDALDGVVWFASGYMVLLSCYRLVRLKRYADFKHQSMVSLPSFSFFVFGLFFSLALFLESVDMFSMRGWYPPFLYFVLDELAAASLITLGILLVDFWIRLSKGIGNSETGLTFREKWGLVAFTYVNFPLWIIVGMSDSAHYEIYEAIKAMTGCIVMLWLIFFSFRSVRQLVQTLSSSSLDMDSPGQKHNNHEGNKFARILIRKYAGFIVIVSLAAIAFLFDAVSSARGLDDDPRAEFSWEIVAADGIDPVQVVIKVIYLLGLVLLWSFFRVPSISPQSTKTADSGGTGHDLTGDQKSILPFSQQQPRSPQSSNLNQVSHHRPQQQQGSDFVSDTLSMEASNPAFVDPKRASDRTILRRDLLAEDGDLRQRFQEFVRKKYASESVHLYDEIAKYRALGGGKERAAAGAAIVARFVRPDASEAVSMPDGVRRALEATKDFAPTTFDAVSSLVFSSLKENFLHEFMETVQP